MDESGENCMKKISIVIPTYNEVQNIRQLCDVLITLFETQLSHYDYEIIIIDNHSTDGTRDEIEVICSQNHRIKAIFNTRNFGQLKSPVYGLKQAYGDCVIKLCADFQDPPEMIVDFLKEWEKGWKIVIGIKDSSEESKVNYFIRSSFYKLIQKISDVEQIRHFTGFGLYDKQFIDILRELDDPLPYLRGIVAELGFDYKAIPYRQHKRRGGKSKNNFISLYDYAMIGITSYSKIFLRISTLIGFGIAAISIIIGIVYLILKLLFWDRFPAGTAPILIGLFFFSSVQLFFIGILGEYIISINTRVMRRPLVIEEKRINFKDISAQK